MRCSPLVVAALRRSVFPARPVFLPQRITPELCDILRRHGPVWMSIHVNHPRECTAELKAACERLSFAGVPLGNQSVLLRGINDDADVMKALMHRLLRMRVRPYYLYQMDLITGGSHFKVDVRRGLEIVRALRGHTTGYAVPQYVIDAPGGGGKVPVNPDYVESITDEAVTFRNYEGDRFVYPLKAGPKPDPAAPTPLAPGVPTLAEQGFPVEGGTYFAILGPAKMPAAIVNTLNREINRALLLPDVREPISPAVRSPSADAHYWGAMHKWGDRCRKLRELRKSYKCANHAEVGRIVSQIMAQYVERVAEERS